MATYNNYPQSAVNNAKKALRHRDENGSSCGTRVGWVRANQIANRENLSDDTVKRVYSFLSRAAVYNTGSYTDEDGNEVCGSIMYDAWGGASMLRWAEPIAKRLAENNAKNMQEININGEIGEWGVNASALAYSFSEAGGQDLLVAVSSPGGSVLEGFAIADAIRAYPGNVTTEGRGYVASIASIILLAGDKVRMAENAFLMIHNPWSMAEGDATDLRKTADVLEKMEMQIAEVYAQAMMKRKGMRYQDALAASLQYMAAETWFTAKEAQDIGLIDEVLTAQVYDIATFGALGRFAAVPMALLNNYEIEKRMNKTFIERFAALFNEGAEPTPTAPAADPLADARKVLEEAGYTVLASDEAEAQELEMEAVLNQAAEKIKAMQAELQEAKAQLKSVAGAPSGGAEPTKGAQAKRMTPDREKAYGALAAMLKDNRN